LNIDRRKLIWGLAALLLVLAVALGFSLTQPKQEKRAEAKAEAAESREDAAENACASVAAYDRLKQQLFARARSGGTADAANFEMLAAHAVVRMEEPVVTGRDDELGITSCRGRLVLELPPGAERAFSGERRLAADIQYSAQAAADGSGLVYTITGAEPIVSRLASFDLQGVRLAPPPTSLPTVEDAAPAYEDEASIPSAAAPAPPPAAEPRFSNPSFDCRNARTRSERMVCSSDRLARRDRAMAGDFNKAMAEAGPRARRVLLQTRDRFLAYRERCADAECIEEAYEGRREEIKDIMEDLN